MNKDLFDLSLWAGMLIFTYTTLGILYRFFGKSGLFCFNAIISTISNVIILRNLKVFEMSLNLSGITFLSALFSLNLMIEKYNKKEATNSVILSLLLNITFTIMINFMIVFNHNILDTSDIHFKILFNNFTYILTILIGTYVFFLSQYINILIYNYFKQIKIKSLWIIHPLSRLISGYIANLLVSIFTNTIFKYYPETKHIELIKGSLIFTLTIIIIDTIFYLFLNSWKRIKEV
ncbi:queuosine precursor transporter [Borreliella yangtzensis]|uniref:queuosine precursor transporter n=1 Tax=Borreliella yangtzensis TaxID=683292 RepID=UPI002649FCA0|nr:queuosine precursor transporter [Borreliella yangtzensis]WKC74892.1 queuosine precursor transporter [Borreliella yangtzensis]